MSKPIPVKLTAVEAEVNDIMLRHGCPMHKDTLFNIMRDHHSKDHIAQVTTDGYLERLVLRGIMRRVRRGVYSAFGPERD